MARPLRYQTFQSMWAPSASASDGPSVRIGKRLVRIADVRQARLEHAVESDQWGVLAIGVGSIFAAMFFVFLVTYAGWKERFLLAAVFFTVFGMISLYEAITSRIVQYVRLRLETNAGEVLFTTVDEADARALMAVVSQR